MSVDIDELIGVLKYEKTPRTQRSIDALNQIISEYYKGGGQDYSITTIGRLSTEKGGIGYESIRATANKHYRDIIEFWACKAKTTTKKPISKLSRKRKVPKDMELLERLSDPALRVFFGQLISERDRLKNENKLLRANTGDIIIDRRPVRHNAPAHIHSENNCIEIMPPLRGVVTGVDLQALKVGIGDENFSRHEWAVTNFGQVINTLGIEVFPRGFMTAIQKILSEIDG